ncbi:MAG: hypothetical protein IKQ35_03190 [Bacilli bacterium]|nr:hypothetical protein [Bacilli bacterium]
MKSFDERLREYNRKLASNPDLVDGINNHKNNSPRAKEVIFSPATETELLLADKVTTLFLEVIDLNDRIHMLEIPKFEDVEYFSYLTDLTVALKEGRRDEIERIKDTFSNMTPEQFGEMFFDSLLLLLDNPFHTLERIQEKTGITDEEEFQGYRNLADKIINNIGDLGSDIDKVLENPEAIDNVSRVVDSFDARYKATISKKRSRQKTIYDNK